MSTADVCTREAAWLNTIGDGLPALPTTGGGPWNVVQAYWSRTPATRVTGLYVMRHHTRVERFSNARKMNTYQLRIVAVWPQTSATGSWEQDQAQFDAALELLITRISGPLADKTHGGRFLSVAEAPEGGAHIDVAYTQVERLPAGAPLSAEVTYSADDPDYTN